MSKQGQVKKMDVDEFMDVFEAWVIAALRHHRATTDGMKGVGHLAWLRQMEINTLWEEEKAKRMVALIRAEIALLELLGISDEAGGANDDEDEGGANEDEVAP